MPGSDDGFDRALPAGRVIVFLCLLGGNFQHFPFLRFCDDVVTINVKTIQSIVLPDPKRKHLAVSDRLRV
ncbi:hypothetical protein VQ042_16595 [Aurantimonas sp. A2-1-M11]|uniref:hypothetical protein n=1 Tax=Aurantimonas sp. A2-1-M11 TaxID=3113712 RepID=UPI002F947CAE